MEAKSFFGTLKAQVGGWVSISRSLFVLAHGGF